MIDKLSQSIIDYYAPYRNKKTKFNTTCILGTIKFEIDDRYEVIDSIGQGAYGIVIACKDKEAEDEENNLIAIKKIQKVFEHKIFTTRTLRELKILRLLKHENIIGIKTIILPKSREEFEDIYVSQELMETDLGQIIKSDQVLTDDHCQFLGLKYIHMARIVHRDLKPRNLLVNSNCDLKICDFGLARSMVSVMDIKISGMTDYVATRWYRAPELLIYQKGYNESIDMWSVGCIFAELLRRKPFLPGTNRSLSDEEISQLPKEKHRAIVKSMPKRAGKDFNKLFENANPLAIDLIKKLLIFDYTKRITVDDALKHPYLSELHCNEDEPICEPVSKYDFEFEEHPVTLQQMKDMIYEEILLYNFPEFQKQYENKKKLGQSLVQHILQNDNKQTGKEELDEDSSSDENY